MFVRSYLGKNGKPITNITLITVANALPKSKHLYADNFANLCKSSQVKSSIDLQVQVQV